MDIATVITGLDALITLEQKYGTTEAGRTMIDGITSDLLDVVPYPFSISFIGLELGRDQKRLVNDSPGFIWLNQ